MNDNSKMGRPIAFTGDYNPNQQHEQRNSQGLTLAEFMQEMLTKAITDNTEEPDDEYNFPEVDDATMRDIGYMPYPDYVRKFVHDNYPSVEAFWSEWYRVTKMLHMYHRDMYSKLSDEMMRCTTKETDRDTFMTGRVLLAVDATLAELVSESNTMLEDWQSHIVFEADMAVADRTERHINEEHDKNSDIYKIGEREIRKLRIVAPLNHKRRMLNYRLNILREKVPQEEIDAIEAEGEGLQ